MVRLRAICELRAKRVMVISMRRRQLNSLVLAGSLLVAACSSSSGGSAQPPAAGSATTAATTAVAEPAATDPPATDPPATAPAATDPPETTTTTVPIANPLELSFLHAEPDPVNGGRIYDDQGREVLLRGINLNSYAEYWIGTEHSPVEPFTVEDADEMSEYGWNFVRLLFTWSRVEPEPGVYDEAYLDELEGVVRMLEERGMYTMLDSHQDAWGPTLAARPGEVCEEGSVPAVGWDGAPGWATLVADETARCASGGVRELSPAVREAAGAFFRNDEGPGGVGIRTRYAEMWGHIAERFANDPAIAGYDLINEPNSFTDEEQAGLAEMYTDALVEIRAAEAAAGGESHIIVFEPWGVWSSVGSRGPDQWEYDDNVAYSPHLYEGSFTGSPLTSVWFDTAVAEAAEFGGAPIITGEWGPAINAHRGTQRTGPDGDGYFLDHQNFQDELHLGATLWMWAEGCGDPHRLREFQGVSEPPFDVDCNPNNPGLYGLDVLRGELTRGYPWFAPGGIDSTTYDHVTGALNIIGSDAEVGGELVVFYPTSKHGDLSIDTAGLSDVDVIDAPGGSSYLVAEATAADWTFTVEGS